MVNPEQLQAELTTVSDVLTAMSKLEAESQRRVLWYVADSLGLNNPNAQRAQGQPQAPNVRTVPLPPGVDPKTAADALRAAGVPVRG